MNNDEFEKLLRKIIREETEPIKKAMATKADLEAVKKDMATKEDVKRALGHFP